MNINICGRNVDVAHPDDGLIRSETRFKQRTKAIEPGQLVGIHLMIHISPLWHVGIHHGNPANLRNNQPRLVGGTVIIKTTEDVGRLTFRQDSNTVVRLLPLEDHVIASVLK